MRYTRSARAAAAVSVLALAMAFGAACDTKDDSGAAAGIGKGGVKTGPGITDDTITLGTLTDLTGPYARQSVHLVEGQRLYIDKIKGLQKNNP